MDRALDFTEAREVLLGWMGREVDVLFSLPDLTMVGMVSGELLRSTEWVDHDPRGNPERDDIYFFEIDRLDRSGFYLSRWGFMRAKLSQTGTLELRVGPLSEAHISISLSEEP